MNGNKFTTGKILKKLVEVMKGWILVGWAQKSPEPCRAMKEAWEGRDPAEWRCDLTRGP
jgi:hypothetical protein